VLPPPVPTPAATPTSARPPTNLPPARTSFIGRTTGLTTLIQALNPATGIGAHLLTLSGAAGSGKTRLALEVADTVLDAYDDGAWVVELASLPASALADVRTVVAATLVALDLQEQPGREPVDTLVEHLRSRHLLLVLDNCEHVVAACAVLATRLLAACPKLQILATSQQPLGIADEMIWRVPALDLPDLMEGAPAPEALAQVGRSEAVQLFVERAQAVQPGFILNAATAASVVAICRQLDGLPLAIELAAARLNVLPVAELLARLDDRFRLLRRGGRIATDRHQTLQATMDWSYGLLDTAEQAVLRRLSVFAGGWDLEAAEAVCAGEAVAAEVVLEALDALLERSLVYVHHPRGVPRYGMLEIVRQYGLQQLERGGEATQVRDRHLVWCVMLSEQAAPALLGREQVAWLARLDREHDNLRAAMHWALDHGLSTPGLRLAGGLWKFWLRRGHQREGRHWLAAFLALPAADDDATTVARATALEGAAWLAEDKHDFAEASALFAQSGALRRAAGQEERTAGLLINAAMEARAGGYYAPAAALLEECLAQNRARGSRGSAMHGGLELSLSLLALVLREQGEYAQAGALCEECLALARELDDAESIGITLLSMSDIARDLGETRRVYALCEQSLAIFRELGHPWAIGFSLNNLALAAHLEGDLALAASRAEESATIFRAMQAEPSLAEILITVGRVQGARGEPAAARASLTEALRLIQTSGPRIFVAIALEELGVQAVGQEQARQGVELLGIAARLRQTMGTPVRPADKPAIEAALAAARAALGASAFAAAGAAGETQTLEQIVAHAGDDA
jgi:non-specific serine/threonine protein kinase